jgi:hypothetical protein
MGHNKVQDATTIEEINKNMIEELGPDQFNMQLYYRVSHIEMKLNEQKHVSVRKTPCY